MNAPIFSGACWFTSYRPNHYGYVRVDLGSKTVSAHRAVYEAVVGPIPEGFQLDHLCRNRACVNPGHLEPVTGAENIRRGVSHHRSLAHCPAGHPYDTKNTMRRLETGGPARRCRQCHRLQDRNLYHARRAAETAEVAS